LDAIADIAMEVRQRQGQPAALAG